MSTLTHSEVLTLSLTGDTGGLSGTVAYSGEIDCSRAEAVLVRFVYTKSTVNLTIGIVDASTSANATIAAARVPLVSTLQAATPATSTTHSITSTTTGAIAFAPGGTVKKARIAMTLSGAGAVADTLDVAVSIAERA